MHCDETIARLLESGNTEDRMKKPRVG